MPTYSLNQRELLEANIEKRREQEIPDDEFYHFDMPLTPETETRLLKQRFYGY